MFKKKKNKIKIKIVNVNSTDDEYLNTISIITTAINEVIIINSLSIQNETESEILTLKNVGN